MDQRYINLCLSKPKLQKYIKKSQEKSQRKAPIGVKTKIYI